MGEVTLVGSIVSLLLCGCYFLWMITFGKPARRGLAQCNVVLSSRFAWVARVGAGGSELRYMPG